MSTGAVDPAVWDYMTIEVPATMPGGYAAGLTPTLPQAEPLHEAGWQAHEHSWLGNGYVRLTLKRPRRPPLPTPGAHGIDLRTAAERTADDAHLAKLAAAPDPIAYREIWLQGNPATRKPALMVEIDLEGQPHVTIHETGTLACADLDRLAAVTTQALATILEASGVHDVQRVVMRPVTRQDVVYHFDPDAPTVIGTPIDDSAARRTRGLAR